MKRLAILLLIVLSASFSALAVNNTQLANDSFTSGSLAAGWSAWPGISECRVVAGSPNVTEPSTLSTACGQIWTGLTWPSDQTSEFTVGSGFVSEIGTTLLLGLRITDLGGGSYSGYYAQVSHNLNQVIIYRVDAGTPTSLSSVSSLTLHPADIWTFQIAGSVLSLYQNGKQIDYIADAAYGSGNPGYELYSNVNVSHAQVSAWRGYNTIQQDGIWTKHGVVISPIANDLAGGGIGTFDNANMLYEGNCQILSSPCFKIWFAVGALGTYPGTAYAESLDGINWTRYATLVLANYITPGIIKVGSTYYMYVQPSSGFGSANFALYTSTNGISWTQQSTNIIGPGTSGQWDYPHIWSFNPLAVIGGTWYALYSAGPNTSTTEASTGLATSTDGAGLTWTKYAGNPVLTNIYAGAAYQSLGGVYYFWATTNNTGRGGPQVDDPAEVTRYQSTDFIHWTNPVKSVHCTQLYEGVNTPVGQCYFNSIINVNGQAYAYTTSSPRDPSGATQLFQIALDIAPVPVELVIGANEDGAQQVANDAFTSGSGNLSSNWATPTGLTKLQIVSGDLVQANTLTTSCGMIYTGATFNANQYSDVTVHAMGSASYVEPTVRGQVGAASQYQLVNVGPTGSANVNLQVNALIGGTNHLFGPTVQITPQVGDVLRLQVVTGSDGFPILSAYQNGYLVLQAEDYNNYLTSGYPGMTMFASTSLANAQISAWDGGNANVTPAYANSVQVGAFAVGP